MDEMSKRNFSSLFNGFYKYKFDEIQTETEKKATLWGSDSESNEDQSENGTIENPQMELEESESDEGEDPLKNLYVKELHGRNTKAE
jgi:hypothetical protein